MLIKRIAFIPTPGTAAAEGGVNLQIELYPLPLAKIGPISLKSAWSVADMGKRKILDGVYLYPDLSIITIYTDRIGIVAIIAEPNVKALLLRVRTMWTGYEHRLLLQSDTQNIWVTTPKWLPGPEFGPWVEYRLPLL